MHTFELNSLSKTPSIKTIKEDFPMTYSVYITDGIYKGTTLNMTNLKLTGLYAQNIDFQLSTDVYYDSIQLGDHQPISVKDMATNILLNRILFEPISSITGVSSHE